MGVSGVLVRDVDRLLGEMTIPDPSVRYVRIADSLDGIVFSVRPDSYYNPDAPKADRVFVNLLSRCWYPGESHYSPGNWHAVSTVCRMVWDRDPTIVVHYIPEPNWIGDLTADEVIGDGHLLTPTSVDELARADNSG